MNLFLVTELETCFFTGRDEIAGRSEKAYECLSVNDALKMLLFSSDRELFEYVEVKFLVHCFFPARGFL